MQTPPRPHNHSHRCKRHAAQEARRAEETAAAIAAATAAAVAAAVPAQPRAPPTRLQSVVAAVHPAINSLIVGFAMGFGGLVARYLWGRFIAHDIAPGTYVPMRMADRTAILNVPDAAGRPHPSVISTTQIDETQATVDTAMQAVAVPITTAATGQPNTEVASAMGTRGSK